MEESIEQQEIARLNDIRVRVREEGIEPKKKTKSENDKNFILNCLKNHFIFYNLSQKELDNVKEHMFWAQMQENVEMFRQGTIGTCFYIIQKGSVEIRVDQEVTKQLRASDGFGELALLYEIERPSTAITKENCTFWIIDKVSFRQAVEEIVISQFQANQKFLQGMAFYQFLRPQQKEKVASSFVTLKYYKGQNIIEEGDPGSSFYMIKEGTASLLQGNFQERKIYKGQSFGHNSLYYNTMRKMTVRAEQDVVCQVLGRETLAKIIGPDFREVMFKNYIKNIIQKHRILFNLLKKQEEFFFQNMKIQYKKANQLVFKKGTTVQKLLIVMEGKLKKFRSANYLAEAGQIWGEMFLNDAINNRLEDDIVVETQSVLIELNLNNIKQIQNKHQNDVSNIIDTSGVKKINSEDLDLNEINVAGQLEKTGQNMLLYLKCQGKHLIGKLYKRKNLEKTNTLNVVRQQMAVSQITQHSFLPTFYKLIETEQYILKITQFIQGESFYDSIRQIGLLSTADTQFYAANMILLLQYFMSQEIVIRDLKPDNFIVNDKGYLRLISFGSAKLISNSHRTSTVIGTPHYMAPEIVLGKEYNELVDLWSVGVMLFQFMVGQLPFGGNTDNPYEIYESIIQGDVEFPRIFKDRRAKKLIETLLNLNPEARYNGSYNNLKANPWFQNIAWDEVNKQRFSAPYKPKKLQEIKPLNNVLKLNDFLEKLF